MRIFLALLLIVSGPAFAKTSVWRVQKGGHTAYIGGTIHVLRQSDYPLPKEFLQAYKHSDVVVFETDLRKAKSKEFQQKMLARVSQKNGKMLQDEISPTAYRSLARYCQSNNLSLDALNKFRASMVSITLVVVELAKLGISTQGVDAYFDARAGKDGKAVGELETPEEQLQFIVDMGKGNESQLILSTLEDMKEMKSMIQKTISSWRAGDTKKLADSLNGDLKNKYANLYQNMVVKRNNNWIPKIEKMLDSDPVEFILVGSGHVIGQDGLLEQLKSRGYKIEQI
jgi:uncharacterized protein YbaP (TraB family)